MTQTPASDRALNHRREASHPVQAVTFYSHSGPHALAYLRLLGPAQELGWTVIAGVEDGQVRPERAADGDVVVIQRDFPADLAAYEQIVGAARLAGKPVILDLDDLLLELPEEHPDRRSHYYARALLPILQALTEADLVTVATPPLQSYVSAYNQRVVTLPNCLNDSFWRLRPPAPAQEQTITLGYMGGASHGPDLEMIASALLELHHRYGQAIQFRFWGIEPPAGLKGLPNVDWQPVNIMSYPLFAEYMQSQRADIWMAPLCDNLFNSCKSPIKFLEYTALGGAGVFSRIEP